ncbi:MAG: hypothetical protein EZS28_022862, partial [Streblomastix strix]
MLWPRPQRGRRAPKSLQLMLSPTVNSRQSPAKIQNVAPTFPNLSLLETMKQELDEAKLRREEAMRLADNCQRQVDVKNEDNLRLRDEISRLDAQLLRYKGKHVGIRLGGQSSDAELPFIQCDNGDVLLKGEGCGLWSDIEREIERKKKIEEARQERLQQKQIGYNQFKQQDDDYEDYDDQSHAIRALLTVFPKKNEVMQIIDSRSNQPQILPTTPQRYKQLNDPQIDKQQQIILTTPSQSKSAQKSDRGNLSDALSSQQSQQQQGIISLIEHRTILSEVEEEGRMKHQALLQRLQRIRDENDHISLLLQSSDKTNDRLRILLQDRNNEIQRLLLNQSKQEEIIKQMKKQLEQEQQQRKENENRLEMQKMKIQEDYQRE